MEISFYKFKGNRGEYQVIAGFHRDHLNINFPDSIKSIAMEDFRQKVELSSRMSNHAMWWVQDEALPIGFLWVIFSFDKFTGKNYGEVKYVHLIPEYRGKGLGQKLLDKADEWAKKQGAQEIRLGTSADNQGAVDAYIKSGYKIKRVTMSKSYE